jgi:hypothetical protein
MFDPDERVVAMSGHVVVPDLASHPRVLAAVSREVRDIGIGTSPSRSSA